MLWKREDGRWRRVRANEEQKTGFKELLGARGGADRDKCSGRIGLWCSCGDGRKRADDLSSVWVHYQNPYDL